MGRKERILAYIEANRGCTKTKVENYTDMAEKTARKILSEMIKDGEVICQVDELNPRIHHLYTDKAQISRIRTKNLLLSKSKNEIENEMYTTLPLFNGEWISIPTRQGRTSPIYTDPDFMEMVRELTKK